MQAYPRRADNSPKMVKANRSARKYNIMPRPMRTTGTVSQY